MGRNMIMAIACAVVAMLLSPLLVLPVYAYAVSWENTPIDWDAFQEKRKEQGQRYGELIKSEEYQRNEEYGNQIYKRAKALPNPVTLQDADEVRELRRELDEFCSEKRALYASADLQDWFSENGYPAGDIDTILERAEKQLGELEGKNGGGSSSSSSSSQQRNPNAQGGNLLQGSAPSILLLIVGGLWSLLYIIQSFMAYGTAYRKAKANGDTGVSLFGWLVAYNIAALIPFLGVYLWSKSKESA